MAHQDIVEHLIVNANNFLNKPYANTIRMFIINYYLDASHSGTACDATKKWVLEKGGKVEQEKTYPLKDNGKPDRKAPKIDVPYDTKCELAFCDRGDLMSFAFYVYASCSTDEKSFEGSTGKGSIWTNHLISSGSAIDPKAGEEMFINNSQGEFKQTS